MREPDKKNSLRLWEVRRVRRSLSLIYKRERGWGRKGLSAQGGKKETASFGSRLKGERLNFHDRREIGKRVSKVL